MTGRVGLSEAGTSSGLAPEGDRPPVVFVSNAPWASTGYGTQTAFFAPRIAELGFDVTLFPFWGLEGGVLEWFGLRCLPRSANTWGNDVIAQHVERAFAGRRGFVLALCDVWVLDPNVYREMPTVAWVPIDHEPAQAPTLRWFRETGATPIAMSRFGQKALADEGIDAHYVPHGVDTSVLVPRPQQESRAIVGLPEDAFVVGMVAANKGVSPARKAFPEALAAFARFRERHTDAVLYLHTEKDGIYGGVRLEELCDHLGISSSVFFCDQYQYGLGFPWDYMARAYSSMDVMMNPSYGEGFGIPIVEAQACGTPVITTNWTAMPELTGVGWTVEGEPYWTGLGSWQKRPYIEAIADALENAYDSRGDVTMRMDARAFAEPYGLERVTEEHWQPVLDELAEQFAL